MTLRDRADASTYEKHKTPNRQPFASAIETNNEAKAEAYY